MKGSHLFVILAGIIILGCANNKDQGEVYHPKKEYMPDYELIKAMMEADPDKNISTIKTKLTQQRDTAFSIGVKSEKQVELFGDVTDLDTDAAGNIYILDDKTFSIRKYNNLGVLIAVHGGKQGKGPGDLFKPMAFEVTDEGIIYVADTFNRVTVLKSDEKSIEYLATIDTPKIMASDICIIEDELFLRAVGNNKESSEVSNNKIVQVYSLKTHEYLYGIGDMYNSGRIGTDLRLSSGFSKIGCIPSAKTVVVAYEFFPFLYGYSAKGELKWVVELNPFRQQEVIEVVSDGIDMKWTFKTDGDVITSIQDLQYEDYFLVQVIRNEKKSAPKTLSYILSSKNGKGIFLDDQVPWLLKKDANFSFIKEVNDGIGVTVIHIN